MSGDVAAGTAQHGRRNLWATSAASFLTDISSEMIVHLLPLYLAGVLGLKTAWIGLIEGVAKAVASLIKIAAGWLSDRLSRKWLTVAGYALSTAAKPFYSFAQGAPAIATVRWAERLGKGIRTAPRDALLADSAPAESRGWTFGVHRAADTLGAVIGLGIALLAVLSLQSDTSLLAGETFRRLVWWSVVPAALAVLVLVFVARDVPRKAAPDVSPKPKPGRPFFTFLAIIGLFELGNSADAFLILRAAERGATVPALLSMLLLFNLAYALSSAPAGRLSDRIGSSLNGRNDLLGRKSVLAAGWGLYAGVYLGFGLTEGSKSLWLLFGLYGVYYGLTLGTAKAMVADLVPAESRGVAYGMLAATLGALDLPASVIAGLLWQGLGDWPGFGAPAPFYFGAAISLLASILLLFAWRAPNQDPTWSRSA